MNQITSQGQEFTLIHFSSTESGTERIACMPNMVEFHQTMYHPVVQRSDDPRGVTCPACKKSGMYVAANQRITRANNA